MRENQEKQKILEIIDAYVHAFESANADQMASLFWLDDPRFIEVENHISEPFGQDRYLDILEWMRKYQKPGWKMGFFETVIHFLGPDVAYSVSMRDTKEDGETERSRVTLVYLKKNDEWRIIHGHFSFVPE